MFLLRKMWPGKNVKVSDEIMFPIMFTSKSLQICNTNSFYHTLYYVGDFKLIHFIIFCILGVFSVFFTYSTARRRRRLSGRHMYMFSRHRKLHFCKIISFISGLECLQKVR